MKYRALFEEAYVSSILEQKGINHIWDMNIESLARAFNINVRYVPGGSCMMKRGKKAIISTNKHLDEQKQYEDFLHELSHYILDTTSFLNLNQDQWKQVELKTDHVLQYVAMPLFLLDTIIKLKTIEAVSEYFFVSHELARKRMESIRNRLTMEV
jgi:Zn-dependent peptidase ImmA (M78 family)